MGNMNETTAAAAQAVSAVSATTDGFHLVIDALKLNGLNTIYGLPGIPITDLTRKAQAAGMRVISFRHEQNAGNAAAIAGFITSNLACASRCRHQAFSMASLHSPTRPPTASR